MSAGLAEDHTTTVAALHSCSTSSCAMSSATPRTRAGTRRAGPGKRWLAQRIFLLASPLVADRCIRKVISAADLARRCCQLIAMISPRPCSYSIWNRPSSCAPMPVGASPHMVRHRQRHAPAAPRSRSDRRTASAGRPQLTTGRCSVLAEFDLAADRHGHFLGAGLDGRGCDAEIGPWPPPSSCPVRAASGGCGCR